VRWVGLLLAMALLGACSREEPRTIVITPAAPPPVPVAVAAVAVPVLAPTPAPTPTGGEALLASRAIAFPVPGVDASKVADNYLQGRGNRTHEAIDIMAPRGTRVVAVDDGKLVKLFTSVPGGLTVYQFDPQGQLAYYYAHLDRYADGLQEGMALRRGDLIGYVGSTGNASPDAPHLHFAVFRLGPEKQWWKGTPVNPFTALRNASAK
jgi:murein DD-endopeptidase MepM/ murein hydrolase activator NlpD